MTAIDKNIKILENCLTPEMRKDVLSGNKKREYASMLEVVLKANREDFMTKELFHELSTMGINTPYEMSEYIIERLYKNV